MAGIEALAHATGYKGIQKMTKVYNIKYATAFAGDGESFTLHIWVIVQVLGRKPGASSERKLPMAAYGLKCSIYGQLSKHALVVFGFSVDALVTWLSEVAANLPSRRTASLHQLMQCKKRLVPPRKSPTGVEKLECQPHCSIRKGQTRYSQREPCQT